MLVEDDKDEFAELLIRNKIERFADSNLTLTIAQLWHVIFVVPIAMKKGENILLCLRLFKDQLTSQAQRKISAYT